MCSYGNTGKSENVNDSAHLRAQLRTCERVPAGARKHPRGLLAGRAQVGGLSARIH